MTKELFTKRVYLGEGYFHYFEDVNGVRSSEECTEEEYRSLSEPDGARNNPVRDGLKWLYSAGGTVKVDTPDKHLAESDYVEVGDYVYANKDGIVVRKGKEEVVNHEIDTALWR